MAKVKNKRNSGLADKVHAKKKDGINKKKLNPFEVHINREKIKVLGKKSKHDRGLPGVSRAKAIQKRKETIGTEMKLLNKTNTFIDRRIGEKNSQLSAEDRMVARFAAERAKQHSKRNIYNLADDEVLTHRGQTLEQIEKFDDPRSSDDEDDGKKFGGLNDDFVSEGHFGGGMLSRTDAKDGAKSHKDLIEQLIAESKKRKAEKQKEKEQTLDLTEKLDSEWKDLQPVVFKKQKVEEESLIDKLLNKAGKGQDYDTMMRELRFEKRGTPSDGLKSTEKQQEEKRRELEELEKQRQQRMLPEDEVKPKTMQPTAKHRSADDLDDNFVIEDVEDKEFMLAYDKEGRPLVPDHILKDYSVPNARKKFDDGISDTSSDDDDDEEDDDEAEDKAGSGEESEDGNESVDESGKSNDEDGVSDKEELEDDDKEANEESSDSESEVKEKTQNVKDTKKDKKIEAVTVSKEVTSKRKSKIDTSKDESVEPDPEDESKESDSEDENVESNSKEASNESTSNDKTKVKNDLPKKINVNGVSSACKRKMDEQNDDEIDDEDSSGEEIDDDTETKDVRDNYKDLRESEQESDVDDECLEDIESLLTLKSDESEDLRAKLEGKSPSQQSAIIRGLIKRHDPGLSESNKELLSSLFGHLCVYTNHIFTNLSTEADVIKSFLTFDKLVPHFYDIVHINKVSTKKHIVDILSDKYRAFQRSPKKVPDLDTLVFFKLISLLYPTSDFRHPVTTPTLIFMADVLSLSRFRDRHSVSIGLFITSLILEYTVLSKRYVPEALNFLRGVLYLCANTSVLNPIQLVPPFRLHKDMKILHLEVDCSNAKVERKMHAKDFVVDQIDDDFKIRCLLASTLMLMEFFDNYIELEALGAVFEPHLQLLDRVDLDLYPGVVAKEVTKVVQHIKQNLEVKTYTPLTREKVRPKALRLYEPDIQEVFTGSKHPKMAKDKAATARLQTKYKKEMKGALREIRRDKAYIGSVKIKQRIQSDNIRKEKVKQIFKDASIQQGELNKLKRMK